MDTPAGYLDLHDYRIRVSGLYRDRNVSLIRGENPASVAARFRADRNELFAHHPQSALSAEHRRAFRKLRYFPYDPAAYVEASVEVDVAPQRLEAPTGGDEAMPMKRVASVRFTLAGTPLTLSLYWIDVYGGGLFLPFHDRTAPRETYGGGRYLFDTIKGSDYLLVSKEPWGQRILLDFNYAYNPSCAYDYRWACPLAPAENHLDLPIRAGEKVFKPAGGVR